MNLAQAIENMKKAHDLLLAACCAGKGVKAAQARYESAATKVAALKYP